MEPQPPISSHFKPRSQECGYAAVQQQQQQQHKHPLVQQPVPKQHAQGVAGRQDPQGEEALAPLTPGLPYTSERYHNFVATADQTSHPNTQSHSTSTRGLAASLVYTSSTSPAPTVTSASSISSSVHSHICDLNNSNTSSCSTHSDIIKSPFNNKSKMMNRSDGNNGSYQSGSNNLGISSLLPDNFAQLSQHSQQVILQQILQAHTTSSANSKAVSSMASEEIPRSSSSSGVHYYNSISVGGVSRDSGISGDMNRGRLGNKLNIGERVAGVGASSEFSSSLSASRSNETEIAASSIVVSLPNHSSSLNMPDSPGPQNRNESNASICSSNNTLVIHGSSSPESVWPPHKWGALLQQQQQQQHTRLLNLSNADRMTYSNSNSGSNNSSHPINEERPSRLYTPAPHSQDPPREASSNNNNSSSINQALNRSMSLSQSPSTLSTRERVLNYISGNSTDLTDIPVSLLDQSQVLKHLLMGANSNSSDEDMFNGSRAHVLNNHIQANSHLIKSSLSVGAADLDLNLIKARASIDGTSINVTNLGPSKLASKSSSSGSVYSSQLDNITPTSGYSSGSTSTHFSLNRSNANANSDDANNSRYNLGVQRTVATNDRYGGTGSSQGAGGPYDVPDLPPPPAYPHWRLERDKRELEQAMNNEQAAAASNDDKNTALTRENLRDISLGRGNVRDVVSLGRDCPRGRGLTGRNTRRDLSLGPELSRSAISRETGLESGATAAQHASAAAADSPTDKASLSRSQPDLSRLNNSSNNNNNNNNNINTTKDNVSSPKQLSLSQRLESSELPGVVDLLYNENTALRLELEVYARKVSKLQKFETEILKVDAAHESLVQICSRREQLEKLARTKLQSQVQSLTKANIDLKEDLESLRNSISAGGGGGGVADLDDTARRELNKRDVIIAQLMAQNKEMLAAKERLEMEVTAQKQTLHEQRTHIDVLDSALANAQNNIAKLEEEVRVKQGNVVQLQQAAADRRLLQADQDRRLQRDVLMLRYQQAALESNISNEQPSSQAMEQLKWEQQQQQQQRLYRDQQQPTKQVNQQHKQQQQQFTWSGASQQQQQPQQQQQHQQQAGGGASGPPPPQAPRRDEDLGEILL